jgi:hypothetical protein
MSEQETSRRTEEEEKTHKSAEEFEREKDEAKEELQKLEEDPPEKLEDWPTGKAKYETFGGPEGGHGYHEGPEQKLGPSEVRHREDGSVEVSGEEVDNPKDFKAEPVPGGPTDPNTANLRMDKATPEDISDVAKEAAEEKDRGGSTEERDSGGGDS